MRPRSPAPIRSLRWALAAALFALAVPGPAPAAELFWLSGQVEIGRGEPPVWQPARPGDQLAPGDAVRTGRDGRAEIRLEAASARLYGDSLLRLPDDETGAAAEAVELGKGHSLFDVLRRSGGERFDVRAREVVVSVKGTRFSVDAGEASGWVEVSVYRGLVGVLAGEAHEMLVREGFAAIGGGDRPFELLLHEATDPWDSWEPEALPFRLRERATGDAPPARITADGAEEAARRSYEADAVRAAIQRRPEVAARVDELAKARAAEGSATGMRAPELARDPVMDLPPEARKEAVEIPFAETWIASQGSVDGSNASDLPFDVALAQDALGGSLVTLTSQHSGETWSFGLLELEVLSADLAPLPTTLETELRQQGIEDAAPLVDLMLQIAGGS